VALQPDNGLTAWWEQLGQDDPYALPPLSIASSEGIPGPSPITTPQYPAEIEMPAENARPTLTPVQPEIEMPGTDVAAEREAEARSGLPPLPSQEDNQTKLAQVEQHQAAQEPQDPYGPGLGNTIPGLGIPTDSLPPMPDPLAAHEQQVDQRVEGSFNENLPETELRSRYEDVSDARKAMSDIEAAQDDADQAFLAKERQNAATLKAATRDREEAEAAQHAWIESRQAARAERAQIDAEAKALAAKPNANSADWFEEGGLGRSVGAFFVGLFGGLGKDYRGLDQINRTIDSFVAGKRADREQQRAALGDRRRSVEEQQADNDAAYREDQVFRKAAYERTLQMLDIEMQNYDPEGSRAREGDNTRRQMLAKMTAAEQAEEMRRAKQKEEEAKIARENARLAIDRQKAEEETRHHKAAERNAAYGISSENKRAKDRLKLDEKKLVADILKDDRAAAKDDRATAKAEEAEQRELGLGGSVKVRRDPATNQPIIGSDGKPEVERGLLRNKDGSILKVRDKGVADSLAKKQAATEGLVDIVDELMSIRDEVGGESGALNSDHSQRMGVLQNRLVILKKAGTEGMSSDEDMKRIEGALGAKDVASFRSQMAGLKEGREGIIAELNRDLKYRGNYTGDPITFENKFARAPQNTEAEEKLKELQKRPGMGHRLSTLVPGSNASTGIVDEQRTQIQALGEAAKTTGPDADRAMKDLIDVAEHGQSKDIREAALRAIQAAGTANAMRGE
jgi:hypothetical protein